MYDGNWLFWVRQGISFSVRVTISALTVLSLCLIWWYTELERRLLVVRHHLSDSINLFNSPLASGLYVELLCCLIHVPPSVAVLRPEWQLLTFIRLYHIVKVTCSSFFLEDWKYNITEIETSKSKMISVYARTPSNEIPQNDRNIENGRFSEIIFDFLTQGKFFMAHKFIPHIKLTFQELFSEETATDAHGTLYIQRFCCWLYCVCIRKKSWNMHAI